MWWLQELQSRRRHFNTKHHSDDLIKEDEWHGSLHGQSLFWIPNASSNLGLLGKASSDEQKDLRSGTILCDICHNNILLFLTCLMVYQYSITIIKYWKPIFFAYKNENVEKVLIVGTIFKIANMSTLNLHVFCLQSFNIL